MAFTLRSGSWKIPTILGMVGLPELGVTEAVAKTVSGGGTTDLSQALTQNYPAQTPTYDYSNAYSPVMASYPTSTGGTGDLLGTNTEIPTGDGGGAPSGPSPEEIYKQQQISNISNKWDTYLSGLDQMVGGLPGQADILKSTANLQAGQSSSDLLASTQENQAMLGKEGTRVGQTQVKTLKDIAANIRNLMQSGQNVLGAMGASGSAPGRYAYALTKLGSQMRGDVVTQTRQLMDNINDRLTKVGNIFTQEKQRIDSELGIQMNNIATWLADQQQAIQQAKVQGQLDKSTDIYNLTENLYNIAVQKATEFQNTYKEQQAALQTWALNNSTTLKEAQQKLAGYGAYTPQTPGFTPISGFPFMGQQQTTGGVNYGGWSGQALTDEEKKQLGLA